MIVVFDLDDTLYNEMDFVKSGFKAVSLLFSDSSYVYNSLLTIFSEFGSGTTFNRLLDDFNTDVSVQDCIEVYRNHDPDIMLSQENDDLLNELSKEYTLGVLTDGNALVQKKKFAKLGLDKYIDMVVFSGEYGLCKPDISLYKRFHKKYGDQDYVYVADNLKKDFVATNKLNWNSIHYRNPNGVYINESPPENGSPNYSIRVLSELKEYL